MLVLNIRFLYIGISVINNIIYPHTSFLKFKFFDVINYIFKMLNELVTILQYKVLTFNNNKLSQMISMSVILINLLNTTRCGKLHYSEMNTHSIIKNDVIMSSTCGQSA